MARVTATRTSLTLGLWSRPFSVPKPGHRSRPRGQSLIFLGEKTWGGRREEPEEQRRRRPGKPPGGAGPGARRAQGGRPECLEETGPRSKPPKQTRGILE